MVAARKDAGDSPSRKARLAATQQVMFSRGEIPNRFCGIGFCSASSSEAQGYKLAASERLLRMANFQVAELQAKARRAARDLAQQFLRCSLDDLDAIEEQEAEVRYRLSCIRKVMRCSRSRCCSRYGTRRKASTGSPHRSWQKQAS